MAEKKSNNTCLYLGLGCFVLVVLGLAVLGGLGYWGYQKAEQFKEDMRDPAKREERAKQILGAETLPEGYLPHISLSVPLVMDMAILGSEPPDEEGKPGKLGERAFIYFKFKIGEKKKKQELRDFFEGRTDNAEVLRDQNIHIDLRDEIRRGVIETDKQTVLYTAHRGGLESQNSKRSEGLVTLMMIECPGDDKHYGMGIWSTPDPHSEEPVAEADFTGTSADEATIRDFMSHFDLCR